MGLITIRGGGGLGDSVYVRLVADYLIRAGHSVRAKTNYPDLFLDSGAEPESFSRIGVDRIAHYTLGKSNPYSTQWQDVCNSARIPICPFRLNWNVRNPDLVNRVRQMARGAPIVLVHGGRAPMGRTDGFGMELLPDRDFFNELTGKFFDCFLVRVGGGPNIYGLSYDLDLTGSTTLPDLIDLFRIADGVIAQCSFALPLAEALIKPLLVVWSSKVEASRMQYVKQITPAKVMERRGDTSFFVVDNQEKYSEPLNEFRSLL